MSGRSLTPDERAPEIPDGAGPPPPPSEASPDLAGSGDGARSSAESGMAGLPADASPGAKAGVPVDPMANPASAPARETETTALPTAASAPVFVGVPGGGPTLAVLATPTSSGSSRFPLLIPVVLWLVIAAGVVAAVLQGWSRFVPRFQFPRILEAGTTFSAFDRALAITGWNDPWRLVIWALAAITIVAGLAATGFALFATNEEPEAVARDGE